ncbi:MAG: hypothetical protein K2X87_34520 [Gemmataceae bacterium]|nr:hypothetical protein [Gemmataceae bacterium]
MDAHWQRMTNRNNATWEQLEPYFGRYVMWNPDYTAILDSDTNYAAILARVPPNPSPDELHDCVVEYLPDPRVEEAYQPLRPLTPEEFAYALSIWPAPAGGRVPATPPGPADPGPAGVRPGGGANGPGAG